MTIQDQYLNINLVKRLAALDLTVPENLTNGGDIILSIPQDNEEDWSKLTILIKYLVANWSTVQNNMKGT